MSEQSFDNVTYQYDMSGCKVLMKVHAYSEPPEKLGEEVMPALLLQYSISYPDDMDDDVKLRKRKEIVERNVPGIVLSRFEYDNNLANAQSYLGFADDKSRSIFLNAMDARLIDSGAKKETIASRLIVRSDDEKKPRSIM